jgi:transposase-like protein
MEEKIIYMYAKGMTTADIESHMHELYDIEISDSTISRITDKILPIVKEWQERPLEDIQWGFPIPRNALGNWHCRLFFL